MRPVDLRGWRWAAQQNATDRGHRRGCSRPLRHPNNPPHPRKNKKGHSSRYGGLARNHVISDGWWCLVEGTVHLRSRWWASSRNAITKIISVNVLTVTIIRVSIIAKEDGRAFYSARRFGPTTKRGEYRDVRHVSRQESVCVYARING